MLDLPQLQELELGVTLPVYCHESLLSSITSTELRKIIFRVKYVFDWDTFLLQTDVWASIGKQSYRLVDRLGVMGYCHTLEVELWFEEIVDEPGMYDFGNFWTWFKREGVVTILDGAQHGSRVFYSSARGR